MRGDDDVAAGLAKSYLFVGLTAEQIAPLAASLRPRSVARDETLCLPGDSANDIWVVLSGELKSSVIDIDGFEVIHSRHGPGMTVGEPGFFSDERTRILSVTAVRPSRVVALGREQFTPFIEANPPVKDRILEALATNSRWQSTIFTSAARKPLRDRLLLRLLELVDSSPERRATDAPVPDIAAAVRDVLAGPSYRAVAEGFAAAIAVLGHGAVAADKVDALIG